MTRAVVAHEIPGRAPLRVRPGDAVEVGERDTEWPAFVLVTADSGEGWVPERLLDDRRPAATVLEPYDTQELPVRVGDDLTELVDDPGSGWTWCRAADGSEGWVPHRVLGG